MQKELGAKKKFLARYRASQSSSQIAQDTSTSAADTDAPLSSGSSSGSPSSRRVVGPSLLPLAPSNPNGMTDDELMKDIFFAPTPREWQELLQQTPKKSLASRK